jgi:PAS domain S-box-containing protein
MWSRLHPRQARNRNLLQYPSLVSISFSGNAFETTTDADGPASLLGNGLIVPRTNPGLGKRGATRTTKKVAGKVAKKAARRAAKPKPAGARKPSGIAKQRVKESAGVPDALAAERAAHARTQQKLKAARAELRRVSNECNTIKSRFETALSGTDIFLFGQDRDLRYTWVHNPRDMMAEALLGRTDDELWSTPEMKTLVATKRKVLAEGVPLNCEVAYISPTRNVLFAVHMKPVFDSERNVTGLMGIALDISRIRLLETEQRRLTEELATTVQRYEFALRGSAVAVFSQDSDLRYTSVSKPLFGLHPEAMLGMTDADLLAERDAEVISVMKREVFTKGEPVNAELRIQTGNTERWYDFHIEPMRGVTGEIVGLTGAAVDMTERKESEAHLRLLMRELTHRSKNLLAVIQAMARQTAKHTGSVEAFLERFSERVQALARSHDLLVAESWHGASLYDLVRSQLAYYIGRLPDRIMIEGPDIQLKPEAAQSLGLALHELAINAARHGALSNADGKVHISWHRLDSDGGFELLWDETEGPKVSAPKRRGFGRIVIEHNLARALDAQVGMDFDIAGLKCRVVVPQSHLAGRA